MQIFIYWHTHSCSYVLPCDKSHYPEATLFKRSHVSTLVDSPNLSAIPAKPLDIRVTSNHPDYLIHQVNITEGPLSTPPRGNTHCPLDPDKFQTYLLVLSY